MQSYYRCNRQYGMVSSPSRPASIYWDICSIYVRCSRRKKENYWICDFCRVTDSLHRHLICQLLIKVWDIRVACRIGEGARRYAIHTNPPVTKMTCEVACHLNKACLCGTVVYWII